MKVSAASVFGMPLGQVMGMGFGDPAQRGGMRYRRQPAYFPVLVDHPFQSVAETGGIAGPTAAPTGAAGGGNGDGFPMSAVTEIAAAQYQKQ